MNSFVSLMFTFYSYKFSRQFSALCSNGQDSRLARRSTTSNLQLPQTTRSQDRSPRISTMEPARFLRSPNAVDLAPRSGLPQRQGTQDPAQKQSLLPQPHAGMDRSVQ
uniref:(northern house mosquito) hypothetical protein n=1 Tax=Culex pipiens TaxID=7175 RepID=A0A8D8ACC3_CULPI